MHMFDTLPVIPTNQIVFDIFNDDNAYLNRGNFINYKSFYIGPDYYFRELQ